MPMHTLHPEHEHTHGANCGHTAIRHEEHVDYVHDGHLHHVHEGHVDEHIIAADTRNPDACGNGHSCSSHDATHKHGPNCGHESVPHGDHVDHIVAGHLHHAHGSHCDSHGVIATA